MKRNTSYIIQLAANVAYLRKRRGYTTRGLAEKIGVDYSYISHIENSRANPSINLLVKIADGLDVDFLDLFRPLDGEK